MKYALAAFVVLALGGTSCSALYVYETSGVQRGHGPPPGAPAYGQRQKYIQGVELRYDPTRDVYVIVGMPNHYFRDGSFYRRVGGHWEVSDNIAAGWHPASRRALPPGLRG